MYLSNRKKVVSSLKGIQITKKGIELLEALTRGKTTIQNLNMYSVRPIYKILTVLKNGAVKSPEALYNSLTINGSKSSYSAFRNSLDHALGYGVVEFMAGYKTAPVEKAESLIKKNVQAKYLNRK